MCKLNRYTGVYPGNRVVHHSEHELCPRSRNGKPCDRAQEFRYPTEHLDSDRLSPHATYEQFPPTPPRSSRSPSTSDSERPRRRSESYYTNGGRVDVSHKPPSPRRERAEHVGFIEATPVPRNATRRYDAPSSRRPPSPYEEEIETYGSSYREPASDTKSNVSTTSSTSSKHSTASKHSISSKHSSSSSTTSKDSKESKESKSSKHSKKNYSEDERDERDSSPPPAARPVKKVIIAEDPAHKSHRRQGSKTREYGSEDEDRHSDDKVRYYTPGEEVQSRINRHNEEIANRPAAPTSASAPKSSAPAKSSSAPKSSSKAVSKPPVTSSSTSSRTKYRRGSVQVDDTMALTQKLDDLIISRQQAEEKERRRQERDQAALNNRLKERLGRRPTYSSEYGADAGALVSSRHRNEPPLYRY